MPAPCQLSPAPLASSCQHQKRHIPALPHASALPALASAMPALASTICQFMPAPKSPHATTTLATCQCLASFRQYHLPVLATTKIATCQHNIRHMPAPCQLASTTCQLLLVTNHHIPVQHLPHASALPALASTTCQLLPAPKSPDASTKICHMPAPCQLSPAHLPALASTKFATCQHKFAAYQRLASSRQHHLPALASAKITTCQHNICHMPSPCQLSPAPLASYCQQPNRQV